MGSVAVGLKTSVVVICRFECAAVIASKKELFTFRLATVGVCTIAGAMETLVSYLSEVSLVTGLCSVTCLCSAC